jgi:hypothetical protein
VIEGSGLALAAIRKGVPAARAGMLIEMSAEGAKVSESPIGAYARLGGRVRARSEQTQRFFSAVFCVAVLRRGRRACSVACDTRGGSKYGRVFAKTATIEVSRMESDQDDQAWWGWGHGLAVKPSRARPPAVNVNKLPCFDCMAWRCLSLWRSPPVFW